MSNFQYSNFGLKAKSQSGISLLMDDLGQAMSGRNKINMLGGGNPAHIPEVQKALQEHALKLFGDFQDFTTAIGNYDTPQGNHAFIVELAELFREEFGWQITEKNIALTHGSQTAFFILFNLFAGRFADGSKKKILLPLIPEYIGYSDVGLESDFFVANKPSIEFLDTGFFKYRVDFDSLDTGDAGAICVSRPTNPTGNVLTNDEVEKLSGIAERNQIPLIIDNAYGLPFPNIVYNDAGLYQGDWIINSFSLSKFGLPAARTGIIVAHEEVIEMISELNAVMSLAPNSLGPALAKPIVTDREILRLSREVILPFYRSKSEHAVALLKSELKDSRVHVHSPEGAMFLWLWIEDLPISSSELYERLKQEGALVVPGSYFFPGLREDWKHRDECIRITYAQDEEQVERGLRIIMDVLSKIL